MDSRAVGFEYGYRLWTGEDVISDEFISPYKITASMGYLVFVFELRTCFRVKSRIDKDDETLVIGSESYFAYVVHDEGEDDLKRKISFRLQEYWMPEEEIEKLVHDAFGFASRLVVAGSDFRLYPVVVGVDVCTVQREGEELDHTKDRAIRAENLVPICLWQPEYYGASRDPNQKIKVVCFLRHDLPRIRVEGNLDKVGLLMETCPVCLRDPVIGDQITTLVPTCRHAFHSHCILRWLLNNNSCPLCRVQVYDCSLPCARI